LYESYIFLELHKRLRANIDLRFWRTKKGDEVDFIWIENRQPIPIEVKTIFSQKNPPKGLLKFMKAYPNTKYGVVFNKKISQDFEIEGVTIKVRKFEEVEELLNEM
jgi:predicted AAA+ superfamily ATPase